MSIILHVDLYPMIIFLFWKCMQIRPYLVRKSLICFLNSKFQKTEKYTRIIVLWGQFSSISKRMDPFHLQCFHSTLKVSSGNLVLYIHEDCSKSKQQRSRCPDFEALSLDNLPLCNLMASLAVIQMFQAPWTRFQCRFSDLKKKWSMSEAKSKITLMSLWPPIVSFFRLKSAPLRATNNFIEPFFTC